MLTNLHSVLVQSQYFEIRTDPIGRLHQIILEQSNVTINHGSTIFLQVLPGSTLLITDPTVSRNTRASMFTNHSIIMVNGSVEFKISQTSINVETVANLTVLPRSFIRFGIRPNTFSGSLYIGEESQVHFSPGLGL